MAENNAVQPQAGKKEEKPKKSGTLESVIDESLHALSSGAKLAGAFLMPYAVTKAVPSATLDTLAWTGSVIAGDATTNFKRGRKHTAGEVLKSSGVAAATALPIHYLYKAINKISLDSVLGYAERAAAFGGIAYPAFVGMYQAVDYVIKNLTFRGVGKYLKENYWPTLKKAWKYILPVSLLNVFFAPSYLQVAIGSALSYFFTLFGAPKKTELKEEEKKDKTPYRIAVSNLLYKAGSGIFNTAYNIGYAISSYFKPAPTAAPAPKAPPAQTAPAPAPAAAAPAPAR